MKLADLNLSDPQTSALLRILDQEVQAEEQRRAEADEEAGKARIYEERRGRITGLARAWARKNGNIEGMPAAALASTTWELFISGEGWFEAMDVDDYFAGDWQEMWESAYISECDTIAVEKGPR